MVNFKTKMVDFILFYIFFLVLKFQKIFFRIFEEI